SEGHVDHVRNTWRRVERVVPRLRRDIRVAEEVRVIDNGLGAAVADEGDDVVVDVEHVPAGVRIARPGPCDVGGGDVHPDVTGPGTPRPAAADAMPAPGELGIAGDR